MSVPIKSYTPKEIRAMYDLSWHQWRKWIALIKEKIGEPTAGKYTPDQVRKMLDHWGEPDLPAKKF